METLRLSSMLAAAFVIGAIGVACLVRAHRSRALPDLAFAVVLLFGGLSTAMKVVVAWASGAHGDPPPTLLTVNFLFADLCVISVYVFAWRVFRPDHPAAKVCLGLLVALFLGELGAQIFRHQLGDGPETLLALGGVAGRGLALGWTSVEALSHYARIRKRVRLDLADPLVANRFLVLGLAVSAACFSAIVGVLERTITGAELPLGVLAALLRMSSAVCVWLGCLPPAWYQSYLQRTTPA